MSWILNCQTFEYPLDLHCSQTRRYRYPAAWCLNTLWIYTALKLIQIAHLLPPSLNTLWIYTALKPTEIVDCSVLVWIPSGFTLLSNHCTKHANDSGFEYPLDLHCSQTPKRSIRNWAKFEYPLDLHCSQTRVYIYSRPEMFEYPLDLHCSQTHTA